MPSLDIDQITQPISPEDPSGPNLEYDPAFNEMTLAADGKAEQQIGDSVVEAEPSDWRQVRESAIALLDRTKDIRVAVCLTRALLSLEGMSGLRDGLVLIRTLITDQWETVHPQLDAEDNNDPTERINAVLPLCDADGLVREVKNAALVQSPRAGKFSLHDHAVAVGDLSPSGTDSEPMDTAAIHAVLMDCEIEDLQSIATALAEAQEAVSAIESITTEHVGTGNAISLSPLEDELKAATRIVADGLSQRGVSVESEEASDEDNPSAAAAQSVGGIQGPRDVIRMIDLICDYYQKHEQSSPIPILLNRAKRLVDLSFLDLVRDLAPEAVSQIEALGGIDNSE